MKELALVAALAAFAGLAPAFAVKKALADSAPLEVSCNEDCAVTPPKPVRITKIETTLILTCPSTSTAEPAPSPPDNQKIFIDAACKPPGEDLDKYCPDATGELVSEQPHQLKLYFPTVPENLKEFYLKCTPKNGGGKFCPVQVLVNSTPSPGEDPNGDGPSDGVGEEQGPGGEGGPSDGVGEGQGPGGQAGTTGVQTCVHSTKTITVRIPDQGSLAQFACESGSTLYPIEPDKVFSKDCKKQETLKNMIRTRTPAAPSVPGAQGSREVASPTYTLKADKKPAKKTLCYLCAKSGTSAVQPGTAADYCTIYVESGAGARFSLTSTVALVLPCVRAALQFT